MRSSFPLQTVKCERSNSGIRELFKPYLRADPAWLEPNPSVQHPHLSGTASLASSHEIRLKQKESFLINYIVKRRNIENNDVFSFQINENRKSAGYLRGSRVLSLIKMLLTERLHASSNVMRLTSHRRSNWRNREPRATLPDPDPSTFASRNVMTARQLHAHVCCRPRGRVTFSRGETLSAIPQCYLSVNFIFVLWY